MKYKILKWLAGLGAVIATIYFSGFVMTWLAMVTAPGGCAVENIIMVAGLTALTVIIGWNLWRVFVRMAFYDHVIKYLKLSKTGGPEFDKLQAAVLKRQALDYPE